MGKRPRNPRIKKRLLKDFGEEQRQRHIGADGAADETDDDENISNTKFYHLRDLPKKMYMNDDLDCDDEESNEDFSPVVSEYIPSPDRQNQAATPSSSLGGDSEYLKDVQSQLSRTPSTISNLSLVLKQIDYIASPSEVFIADNYNSCYNTPKTKNQKRCNVENIVDISLKPASIRTDDCVTQPRSANISPGAVVNNCTTIALIHNQRAAKSYHVVSSLSPHHTTDEHRKEMQMTELDTTLKPDEKNSTLHSSLPDSDSFYILNPLDNNNISAVVTNSRQSESDLPSNVDNPVHEIAKPSNADTGNNPTSLVINVPSTAEPETNESKMELITSEPGNPAPPSVSHADCVSQPTSANSSPGAVVNCTTVAIIHDQRSLKTDHAVLSLTSPHMIDEHTKAMQMTELDTTVKPDETISTLRSSLSDSDPFSILDSVDNNNSVTSSCHPESDLASKFNNHVHEIVTDTRNDTTPLVPFTADPDNNKSENELITSEPENHAPPSECENNMSAAENKKRRTRKRKLDIDNWQCKKNKKLKDSGLAYKGCHSKKDYPAKTVGPSCTCKKLCSERISPQKRKEIFDKFYKIGNHEYQWQFIIRNVKVQDVKRITLNRKCNRRQTLKYYFYVDGLQEFVCKTFFLNTLNISDSVIFTALDKVKRDESLVDLRGSHKSRPHTTNWLTEESVVNHINLFPTVEAHYVRKDSEKLYLQEDLNISLMYRLYKKWFAEQNYHGVKMASARQYRKIFNTQFNYSFFKPKKDQCALCIRYEQADEETKTFLQTNYDKHIQNKTIVRNIKDAEKEKLINDTETIAIFDLEKVVYIPKSEVGVFYYKRKYPVYNFTVYDAGRKLGYCFMWHHTIAKRGAIEIGSCLLKFLENEHKRSVNKISLYSDGCRGQNKNRFIFALYLYAAAKFEMNITHRFFETGHSQNEGDSMHACMERQLKKNKFIYTPEQMYAIAMNAKVTDEKYNIVEMDQSDFLNIKLLIDGQNWVEDSNGKKITWPNIMEVNTCHTHPNKLKFKYNFEEEYLELNTSELRSRARRGGQNVRESRTRVGRARSGQIVGTPSTAESRTVPELQRAYSQPFPVSKALHSDLLSLCKSHDIPRHYHDFYESLLCETGGNVETQDSSHEDSVQA